MNEYDIIIPYLVGAVVAIVTAIVVKIISSKAEKQSMGNKLSAVEKFRVERNVTRTTFRCPKCGQTFMVEEKTRPYKVRCPHCDIEGMIK